MPVSQADCSSCNCCCEFVYLHGVQCWCKKPWLVRVHIAYCIIECAMQHSYTSSWQEVSFGGWSIRGVLWLACVEFDGISLYVCRLESWASAHAVRRRIEEEEELNCLIAGCHLVWHREAEEKAAWSSWGSRGGYYEALWMQVLSYEVCQVPSVGWTHEPASSRWCALH
jgi:hypothetical protein